MLILPRRSDAWLLVTHHYRPRTNLPLLRDAIPHIRIVASELFGGSRIARVKDEQRARGRIGQRAGEDQFAARVGLAGEAKVFIAIGGAPSNEVVHHVVHEREIWHWKSPDGKTPA